MLSLNGRLGSRKVVRMFLTRYQSSTTTSTAKDTNTIQIPRRIERGPTDILKALGSTVKRDPTAPHYKYLDDPYFIPTSNMTKRSFALAREAGRKAALWIRQEHRDLYDHRIADPVIEKFLPRAVYDENSEVTEETLRHAIQNGQVSDATTMYSLLNKASVSLESKQALLELLCFTNGEELTNEDLLEERWFTRSSQKDKPKWRVNELTEELFTLLKNENNAVASAAYNSMICGTAKFLEVERAWMLYQECLEKSLPLCVRCFNSILRVIQFFQENGEQKNELMIQVLQTMGQQNTRPDLGTLNAALQILLLTKAPYPARERALSIYKEITDTGVEPSIGTYSHLLTIFCRSTGPRSQILLDILDKIEGKEFEIRHSDDLHFFVKAMEMAKKHLINPDIAHRLHKLLLTGNNYNFLEENYAESVYYRYYLTVIVQTQPMDQFMALYDAIVPHAYIPESDVLDEILQAIELTGANETENLLPRLWSNIVIFDHVQRSNIIIRVLQIMHSSCRPAPTSLINKQYGDIAWDIWTHVKDHNEKYKSTPIFLDGEILGKIAVLEIRGGYFDRMLIILSDITERDDTFSGVLSIPDVDIMLDACIEHGHATAAVNLVGYAVNNDFSNASEMGYKVAQSLSLNFTEETKLVNLVGSEVLQSKEN